jgi:preprotein translocase subunit SecY
MLSAPLLSAAVDAFRTPDLRRKLLCTFGMLVASHFIAQLPIRCADLTARRFLRRLFEGALSSLSVAALGVCRYTTAH